MALVTYPHGPLTQLASNLWVVCAPTSQQLDRKMTVARGEGGGLFLYDALWLEEAAFAALDALGPVSTLFVPSPLHDFDGERFAERYPKARMCGTRGTVRKLKWKGLAELEPAMAPGGIALERIPGVRAERVCRVTHPEGGESLVFNDALFNLPPSADGLFLRLAGSRGPLHMSRLGKLFLLKDKRAFRQWLEEQSRRAVRHVIVGHGEVVSQDAPAQLAAAAGRL